MPIVDRADDPSALAAGLLSGAVAPWHGRRRNRVSAAEGALGLVRAFDLERFDDDCTGILEEESAISPTLKAAAESVAARFGLRL